MASGSAKKMTTMAPLVFQDDNKISFTEAEMRRYTRYFRNIAWLAKVKRHRLADILEVIANIMYWQTEAKKYTFSKGFINYLLRYQIPFKKLAAEYRKEKRGPAPPPMIDGQSKDDMKIEAQY